MRNRLDPKVIEEYNLREDLTGNECAEGCVYSKKGLKFRIFLKCWCSVISDAAVVK